MTDYGKLEGDYPPEKSALSAYYHCVGRVAMGWASLEMRLNYNIWKLAGVDQYAGACITSHIMSVGPRFRALIALATYRGASKQTIKSLNSLSNKTEEVARQRNRIVHDPAFVMDEKYYRLHITADRVIDFGMKETALADFQALEMKIGELLSGLHTVTETLFGERPPYDDRSFRQGPGIYPHPPVPDSSPTFPENQPSS